MILHLEDIGQNYQAGGKRYLCRGKIPIKPENDEGAILIELKNEQVCQKSGSIQANTLEKMDNHNMMRSRLWIPKCGTISSFGSTLLADYTITIHHHQSAPLHYHNPTPPESSTNSF